MIPHGWRKLALSHSFFIMQIIRKSNLTFSTIVVAAAVSFY
jgi:hypothetical protein